MEPTPTHKKVFRQVRRTFIAIYTNETIAKSKSINRIFTENPCGRELYFRTFNCSVFLFFLLDIFIRIKFPTTIDGKFFYFTKSWKHFWATVPRVSKKASFCHVSVGREKGKDNFGHVRVLSPSVTRYKAVMFVCARNLRIARIPFAVNSEHVLVDGLVISDVTATCLTLNANVTPRPDDRVRRDYSLMSASVVLPILIYGTQSGPGYMPPSPITLSRYGRGKMSKKLVVHVLVTGDPYLWPARKVSPVCVQQMFTFFFFFLKKHHIERSVQIDRFIRHYVGNKLCLCQTTVKI